MSARDVSRDELLSLAERLDAGEDPKLIAAELKRMATGKQSPGRPKDPPAERALRKLHRKQAADEIFRGIFPEWLCPPNPDLALAVKLAKGKRTDADELAATILGKGHSVRSIQKARERRRHPMNRDEWEEEKALMRLCVVPEAE